jgi:hypothetical protein
MGNRIHSRNIRTIPRRKGVSLSVRSNLIDGNDRRTPRRDSRTSRVLIAFSGSPSNSNRPWADRTGAHSCLLDQDCFSRSWDYSL